jgi:hypothetical protein
MDIDGLQRQIIEGTRIEDALQGFDWKEFEDLCAQILERHGWDVKRNFRFRTDNRYEIDVFATRGSRSLAIDCKHWGIRKGKKSQLRTAADMQSERVAELKKIRFLYQFGREDFETHPLVVTWYEEEILREGEVWIVPISKLNSFLLDLETYLES